MPKVAQAQVASMCLPHHGGRWYTLCVLAASVMPRPCGLQVLHRLGAFAPCLAAPLPSPAPAPTASALSGPRVSRCALQCARRCALVAARLVLPGRGVRPASRHPLAPPGHRRGAGAPRAPVRRACGSAVSGRRSSLGRRRPRRYAIAPGRRPRRGGQPVGAWDWASA
jgi:hypothetical protein